MSTGAVDRFGRDVGAAFPGADRSPSSLAFRGLALACSLVLVGSTLLVLREITGVVGGTNSLYAIVAAALATGTVAAAILRERTAAAFALVVAAIGFAYYFTAAGVGVAAALSHLDKIVSDTITLATGLELLRMVEAGTWALAFAPAPAFLTWYLALRRRYALAVVPGGLALSFLVLTGDAGTTVTLAGTVAGIGVVGFGELERRGGTIGQADALAVLLAAMMLLSLAIPLVPGGSSDPAHLIDGEGPGTLEGSVVGAEDRSTIEGSVSLSPEVRYTIESDEPAYWRTNVYDRFTGDEWVVSGEHGPYDGRLAPPPGDGRPLVQEVAVEADIQAMPMANHPIAVDDGVGEFVEVTDHDQFRPTVTLTSDDSYTVESAVIDPDPDELRAAGTDYPAEFDRDRYLQQPEDVSTAFEERTSEIVDGEDNPYDAAVAIEEYLRSEKGYSLDVDAPDGNVAEEFLLEMEEGYCVYFATAMVQMLRAEDVPARYATGYTPGQQVDDDTWVVRGLDAHAWVEVYFPGHGWVEFEPTPPSDRDSVHAAELEEARAAGEDGVDTEQSEDVEIDHGEDRGEEGILDPDQGGEGNVSENASDDPGQEENRSEELPNGGAHGGDPDADPGEERAAESPRDSLPIPSTERIALGLVVLFGAAAGAHRAGVGRFVSREVRLHWQRRRTSPDADVERAYRRLELALGRRYRPRRPSETSREYLEALSRVHDLDPRVREVAAVRERATYGDGVDREAADAAIEAVDGLVRGELPLVGRRLR